MVGRHISTRQHLLDSGTRLARKGGLRGLTVRGVCEAAGANPGTFVYHFGTRDAFIAELIERWYAPLMSGLTATVDRGGSPRARLRALVLQLATWAAANSRFITTLVLDAAAKEPAAQRFLRSLAGRHPPLILRVLREGQQAGELRTADPLHQLLFLMSAMALPILLTDRMADSGLAPRVLAATLRRFARDRHSIEQRLDWVLAGLSMEAADVARH
ncbi:MAG TPA: TetR/AcrR family transcriptional regulator [Burkholderiaceae bacterium]|nr:TetR/AcrR family transcriptional regulator [Burkholderiaceae bacterium]